MTFDEWHSNPALREGLRSQLNSTLWQTALSVLQDLSYANQGADTPTNIITGNGEAIAGKILGYEKCRKNLLSLADDPPTLTKTPPIETYGVPDASKATE